MESIVDQPCPLCSSDAGLKMIALTTEIPYFGEHTQITLVCDNCGWKQTDFIPAEGKVAGIWSIKIDSADKMNTRIVRSSSGTIRIVDLDLEVEPGASASGYITNIEGVINRFEDSIGIILRQAETDGELEIIQKCEELMDKLMKMKNGELQFTIEIIDPRGHSQILDDDAVFSQISDN